MFKRKLAVKDLFEDRMEGLDSLRRITAKIRKLSRVATYDLMLFWAPIRVNVPYLGVGKVLAKRSALNVQQEHLIRLYILLNSIHDLVPIFLFVPILRQALPDVFRAVPVAEL